LDSFGLKTRVAEINKEEDYIEYCLEIVVGLNLDELEKHSRDLALALASPTGKVKMIIPIPGRALVGIQVPKPTREELEKMKMVDEKNKKLNSGWRKSAGDVVKIIGALFFALGEKISKE
jgi:DNA segregation ATPase FtsK/SpoIIIE-like protein